MIPINKLNPFRRFCMTIGELPTSYVESMSYAELLTWMCNYLEKTVIPAINNNGEAVTELQNLFKELENFVVNYVESPEFIENIDNKLDEMAEDGTFDQIINTNITGSLSNLETTTKANLVGAINEVNNNVGKLSDLTTTDNSDVVNAINEVNGNLITNVNNINQTLDNVTNSLNPIDLYKNKNLVVFGDSFSEEGIPNSVDAQWVSRVCEATGMISKNFANAGAGFARTSNLISNQLYTALNELTEEDINNTAVVIIYAGYNDIANEISSDNIVTECVSFVNDVCATFQKAKVILAPFNWSFNYLTHDNNIKIETLINKISRDLSNKPITVLKLARYWCLGINSYFQNAVHPNENGYNKIASYFINAIYGGSEHVGIGEDLSSSLLHGISANKRFYYMYEDGNVYMYFSDAFENSLSNYSDFMISNLHPLLCPEHDILIPLYKVDDYEDCGYLRLTTSGSMTIHISSLPANTTICATPITFKASVNTAFSE